MLVAEYTACLVKLWHSDYAIDEVITQCHRVEMLSHYLKELNTAIQCLGIKPKAIKLR